MPSDTMIAAAYVTFEDEIIARAAHEVNRAWCLAHGDPSQVPWEEAEDWQRKSAIRGVRVARGGATSEALHEAWCADKRAEGWTWGPTKDTTVKTHPCLVPYADLPPEQRAKDVLFGAVVRMFDEAFRIAARKVPC